MSMYGLRLLTVTRAHLKAMAEAARSAHLRNGLEAYDKLRQVASEILGIEIEDYCSCAVHDGKNGCDGCGGTGWMPYRCSACEQTAPHVVWIDDGAICDSCAEYNGLCRRCGTQEDHLSDGYCCDCYQMQPREQAKRRRAEFAQHTIGEFEP